MSETMVLWVVFLTAFGFAFWSFNQNSFTPLLTSIGFAVLAGVMLYERIL